MDQRKSGDYNPKRIGEKSEAQVLARFLVADKVVLQPFGDNQRYDLVVDEDGDFIRVQCKTGALQDGSFLFPTCSTNWNTGKQRGYAGQADVFAVYVRELDQVYIFKVEGLPKKCCTVRLTPGQQRTRRAENHLFDPAKPLRGYP